MFARFHLPSFWLTPLPRSVLWPSLMWKLSSLHLFIHQHVVFFLSWLSLLTEWSTLCSFSMFISPWLCPSHFCPPYRNCSIVTLLCLPPFWVFFLSSSPCLSWDAPFSSLQALCWPGIAPRLYLLLFAACSFSAHWPLWWMLDSILSPYVCWLLDLQLQFSFQIFLLASCWLALPHWTCC